MQVRVEKVENRLFINLPEELVAETNLEHGSVVDIVITDGELVLTPVQSRFTIEELVAGITDENRHSEIDFGPPVGKELL